MIYLEINTPTYYFAPGEMAERSNAAVLKTVDCNRSGGSNPSLSAETPMVSFFMPYFVYIIYSLSKDRFYIGQTQDFTERIRRHNAGMENATKPYKPWISKLPIENRREPKRCPCYTICRIFIGIPGKKSGDITSIQLRNFFNQLFRGSF